MREAHSRSRGSRRGVSQRLVLQRWQWWFDQGSRSGSQLRSVNTETTPERARKRRADSLDSKGPRSLLGGTAKPRREPGNSGKGGASSEHLVTWGYSEGRRL